jgi:hypothetical protein
LRIKVVLDFLAVFSIINSRFSVVFMFMVSVSAGPTDLRSLKVFAMLRPAASFFWTRIFFKVFSPEVHMDQGNTGRVQGQNLQTLGTKVDIDIIDDIF